MGRYVVLCAINTDGPHFEWGFNQIIEFAGIRYPTDMPGLEERMHCYIRSEHLLAEDVSKKTGITNEMMADAPRPEQVLPRIINFLCGADGAAVVFFNGRSEYKALISMCLKYGCTIPLCVVSLAIDLMRIYKSDAAKLSSACRLLNVVGPASNRAMDKAEAIQRLWNARWKKKNMPNTL